VYGCTVFFLCVCVILYDQSDSTPDELSDGSTLLQSPRIAASSGMGMSRLDGSPRQPVWRT
jgi:hypothetical protein